MRVALISSEYVGFAQGGGIGTYVRNAAQMLAERGHDVEVFTTGRSAESVTEPSGVRVHTLPESTQPFSESVIRPFRERHESLPFEVVEGPDYRADALTIGQAFPDVPLVVKLHTPSYLLAELWNAHVPWTNRARFAVSGLLRGRWPRPYSHYDSQEDSERSHALNADLVVGPSQAILDLVGDRWGIPEEQRMWVPNVFNPPSVLLDVPIETRTEAVLFVGKLEVRKGVLDLAAAVPEILRRVPSATFRFVGRTMPHPATKRPVRDHMEEMVGAARGAVEFVDAVPYEEVVRLYAHSDICVFPSVWENFPNVCFEAMSAGRGVVGSEAGGMAEQLDPGRTGLLVPPRDPKAIASAVVALLRDPSRRQSMGRAAREEVTTAYRQDVIGPIHEASYRRAIERHEARGGKRS